MPVTPTTDQQRFYHSCNLEFWRVEERGGLVYFCYQVADEVIRTLHCPKCHTVLSDNVLQTTPYTLSVPTEQQNEWER